MVVIPPGLRKEEIATLLTTALGWTTKQKTEWITKSTTTKPEYIEGVYAPDTYLIPVGEKPSVVATRLIAKFNEGFAPYLPEFTDKNIKWTSALTLASIVQREAANVADMPLIAGILWNRLDQNMALDVDSTLQYARGNIGAGWWARSLWLIRKLILHIIHMNIRVCHRIQYRILVSMPSMQCSILQLQTVCIICMTSITSRTAQRHTQNIKQI